MLRRLISSGIGVLALLCVTSIPGQAYARGTMRSGMTTPTVRFGRGFSPGFRTFNGFSPGFRTFNGFSPRFNGGFNRFGTFSPGFGLRFGAFRPGFERPFTTSGFSPMFDRQFMDPRIRGF